MTDPIARGDPAGNEAPATSSPASLPPLAPRSLAITPEAIMTYAEITGDFNPLHVDPEFARNTPMGGIIAHGTLSLNLVWQALADAVDSATLARMALEVRFMKPVQVGDVVTAGATRRVAQPRCFDIWVTNQHGVTVIGGTATIATSFQTERSGS